MDYLTLTIGKQKKIALIAHDEQKTRAHWLVRCPQGDA